ncbi:hypothetical protein SOVF_151370 [Spinacia oleracea]|nr:hypothetical protein SOVF_151370 [Spinacia oleracea]
MNILKHQPNPTSNIQRYPTFFFIILLLSPLYSSHPLLVRAQNVSDSGPELNPFYAAGIGLTSLAVVSFLTYIAIYLFFKRFVQPWAMQNPDHRPYSGIDPFILRTFPVFLYTDHVSSFKHNKGPGECVVCLGLFERDEMLRLLPKCGHVFHVGCVDPWLVDHVTCPLCRANLLISESDELIKLESGCVDEEAGDINEVELNSVGVHLGKIRRWNSMGHVARFDGIHDKEKSTLVKNDIVTRELSRTKSCTIIIIQ